MSVDTNKVAKYIGYADKALDLIPELPGRADNVAIMVVRGIFKATQAALIRRTPSEVLEWISELAKEPAEEIDLDEIAERVKAKLQAKADADRSDA